MRFGGMQADLNLLRFFFGKRYLGVSRLVECLRKFRAFDSRRGMLRSQNRFLAKIADVVIQNYGSFFPELAKNRSTILVNITREEERFQRTVDVGVANLNDLLDLLTKQNVKTVSGGDAFNLYATFGLPLEIMAPIVMPVVVPRAPLLPMINVPSGMWICLCMWTIRNIASVFLPSKWSLVKRTEIPGIVSGMPLSISYLSASHRSRSRSHRRDQHGSNHAPSAHRNPASNGRTHWSAGHTRTAAMPRKCPDRPASCDR